MEGDRPANRVRAALAAGRFLTTVEFATPPAGAPFEEAIRPVLALAHEVGRDPRIDALAITDRSRSDHDHDPIALGGRVAETGGKVPIVHWAGKDRGPRDLESDLRRAAALRLDTFLLVTGDKVRHPPAGRAVRYLDSVNALDLARRQQPPLLLAAAVSPFKYREEELMNQYLKAVKKLHAGAEFLITQLGWDMPKLEEARHWFDARGGRVPLVAEVLFLTPRRARHIRKVGLAGVIITDSLARKLEEEAQAADGGVDAAFRRLALQIVGAHHLGYQGAQISGLHAYEKVARLLDEVERMAAACPTPGQWRQAWDEMMTAADGRPVQVGPAGGFYLESAAEPSARQRTGTKTAHASGVESARFRTMRAIDHTLFREGSPGARLLGPVLRSLDARSSAGRALRAVEGAVKGPLLGCQTCGFCRLPYTAFVCPETCPKGLANGPCGGTRDNVCEFGDRECIHNQIYRLSKESGRLRDLEEVLIPPVPADAWGTCSWVTHFRGEGPQVERLPVTPTGKRQGT